MTPGEAAPIYTIGLRPAGAVATVEWLGPDRYYYQPASGVWRSARCAGIERQSDSAAWMVMPDHASGLRIVNAALEVEAVCALLRLPVATHYVNLTPDQADTLGALAGRWHLPCSVIRSLRRRWLRQPLPVATLVAPLTLGRIEYDAAHPDRPGITAAARRKGGVLRCDNL